MERLQRSGDTVTSLDDLGIDDATLDTIRSACRSALEIDWAARTVVLRDALLDVDVVKRQEVPNLDPTDTGAGRQPVETKRREFDPDMFAWEELCGLSLTKQLACLVPEIGTGFLGCTNKVALEELKRITRGRIGPNDEGGFVMIGDTLDKPRLVTRLAYCNQALSALRKEHNSRREGAPPGRPSKNRGASS